MRHLQNADSSPSSELAFDELPLLLSKSTVCRLLDGVTTKHVENLGRSGRMPEPVYLGRRPSWQCSAFLEWIEAGCPVVDSRKLAKWQELQAAKLAKRKSAKN